ncbi:hypothetical protein FXO37_27095 [Capsicum annuum]|nr:hypothetical protein FXO37_27095 [Capsicum annuum]
MAKGRKKVANKIQISAAPVKANPHLGKTIAVHTSPGQKLDKEPSLTPPILLEARSASKEYVVILSIFRGWKLCRPELRTADHSKSHLIAFSAIYELHTIEERKELWASIENLESSIHNPWLLMGDFNANLRGKDRNTTVMDAEIKDFENLMTNAGLHKLTTIGRFFTWTNSYVHSKLDKALVNGVWLRKWPHLEVEVTHFSYHSLLYVSVKEV